MRILNKCEIPLRPPGKDVALPGTEKKIGVIQGGAVQTKITHRGQTANQNFYIKKIKKKTILYTSCKYVDTSYSDVE